MFLLRLFEAEPSSHVTPVWKLKLEESDTDADLMKIVSLGEFGKGKEWLWLYIKEQMNSLVPIDQARSICLLGFFDSEEAKELLENLLQNLPDTWLKKLATKSLYIWKKNKWAKYWYRRFLSVEDNILAWASFRLFLRCVDSRFWFWREKIEAECPKNESYSLRNGFMQDNLAVIKREIKDNEKDLREIFLGQKVLKGDVWPWMS